MNSPKLIEALARFPEGLAAIVHGVLADDARWKPADGAWSILEVVRHLVDEEIEDFRTRLRLTLEAPATDWPAIDPPGWASQRRYNDANLEDSVWQFVAERRKSVTWLRELHRPDWSTAHTHPKLGPIHAGDLLASWAAHDALHLRQIAKRKHQLAGRDGEGFTTAYAGEWSA
jgi:hypothetical protein